MIRKHISYFILFMSLISFQALTAQVAATKENTPIYKSFDHKQDVTFLLKAPDGKHYFSASRDNRILMHEYDTTVPAKEFAGHTSVVTTLAISHDGKYLMSGSDDGSAILWDVESAKILQRLRAHQGTVTAVAISPDADSKRLYSAGTDGNICVFDRTTGCKLIRTTAAEGGGITCMLIDPYGSELYVGANDGKLRIYSAAKDALLGIFEGAHTKEINAMALSPDAKSIATGSNDRTCLLWDIKSKTSGIQFSGHTWKVLSVDFNPSGEFLTTGSNDGSVKIWKISEGKEVANFSLPKRKTFYASIFSPDSKYLVTGLQVDKPIHPAICYWPTELTAGADIHPDAQPMAPPVNPVKPGMKKATPLKKK